MTLVELIIFSGLHRIDYGIAANAFHPISTTNLAGLVTGMYFLYIFHAYMPGTYIPGSAAVPTVPSILGVC
jgi:hypothetical protein